LLSFDQFSKNLCSVIEEEEEAKFFVNIKEFKENIDD
jgi:hypothetical protein